MALESENGGIGATMLVGPTSGYPVQNGGFGGGFGGDWGWIVLLLLLAGGGGWGMGGFGGSWGGMMGMGIDFPWLLNGQNQIQASTADGFRSAQLSDGITSVRDGISSLATQLCGCCGDMQMALANGVNGIQQSLCNGFAGTTAAVTGAQNAISQQLYSNELASLNRSFAEQTANTAGFTGVNSGIADLRYTVATEACADRAAVSDALRDVIAANTASTQRILDQLCADKIEAKNDEIAMLRQQLNMADLRASQTAQNAFIANEINQQNETFYNRLSTCPIPATPVYGRTPIFTCGGNSGCGCGGFVN